jgi:hypothetical protein
MEDLLTQLAAHRLEDLPPPRNDEKTMREASALSLVTKTSDYLELCTHCDLTYAPASTVPPTMRAFPPRSDLFSAPFASLSRNPSPSQKRQKQRYMWCSHPDG